MRSVIKRAVIIAAIVAPILTLINQWEAFAGDEPLSYIKVVLTAFVPFTVSLVSGMMARPKG